MSSKAEVEWDARAYHRLGNPQHAWAQRVLERLLGRLRGDEVVLDAGCGSGRVTAEILERAPGVRVIALDRSENMLEVAQALLSPRFGARVSFACADLASLFVRGASPPRHPPETRLMELRSSLDDNHQGSAEERSSMSLDFDELADVVFSTATLHWVTDHPRLFSNLRRALRPGGRLVAQCGGGPNLARLLARAEPLLNSEPLSAYLAGMPRLWEFADDATTARRLAEAGFVDIETSLEPEPTVLRDEREYSEFLGTVVLGRHLARVPDPELRAQLVESLVRMAASDDPPWSLDYWRLNLAATKP